MLSREYIFKNETVSTSSDLKEIVRSSSLPVYAVIIAERQSGGRGRMGKSFFSPKGGIYFSASFPISGSLENAPFITLLAGLYVCKALEKVCSERLYIKWPNDIYLGGKKLCGILAELINNTAVVGVGINCEINSDSCPPELKDIVTSLSEHGIEPPDKKALIAEIVSALDRELYRNNALAGKTESYARQINARFYLKDKNVKIASGEKEIFGKALRVSPKGALVLQTENGEEEVISGTVFRVES